MSKLNLLARWTVWPDPGSEHGAMSSQPSLAGQQGGVLLQGVARGKHGRGINDYGHRASMRQQACKLVVELDGGDGDDEVAVRR